MASQTQDVANVGATAAVSSPTEVVASFAGPDSATGTLAAAAATATLDTIPDPNQDPNSNSNPNPNEPALAPVNTAVPQAALNGPKVLRFGDQFNQMQSLSDINSNNWHTVNSSCANLRVSDSHLYSSNNVAINDSLGGLAISPLIQQTSLPDCNITKNYTSGRVQSNYCFKYGRLEVLAKMPAGVYTWPAIWLECFNCTDTSYFEIDLIETYGTDFYQGGEMSVFYTKNHSLPHAGFFLGQERNFDLVNSFYNYTAIWIPGSVTFYFNETLVSTYDYSSIPGANTLDDGCAVVTMNVAIEGTARDGQVPSDDLLAADAPSWTPMVIQSVKVFDPETITCVAWGCETHDEGNPALRIDEEIPVAVAVSLFLLVLVVMGLARCKTRLTLLDVGRAAWTTIMIVALLAPAIIGYFLHWEVVARGVYALGTYGIFTMAHYSIQILCVILEKVRRARRSKALQAQPASDTPKKLTTAISNAVYREDPSLFRACLESLKVLHENPDNKNKYIIVVADGNRPEEEYLIDVFVGVFGEEKSAVLRLETLEGRKELKIPESVDEGKSVQFVFVTQPWGGKREAMYTAMAMVVNDPEVEAILTTDSDTVFDANALNALSNELLQNPLVGAVAGECRIINRWDSFISYISDVRYHFAFNIERACQSYWNAVVCVSGPIGMYRTAALTSIMDPWVHQTFFKQKCTYGDDRHLTNLYLNGGWKIVYTPEAFCYTASPTTVFGFFTQQTRWSKSFYREYTYSLPHFYRHPLWFGYELTFQLIYPFLLIYWQMILLYTGTYVEQLLTVTILVSFAVVKAGAGWLLNKGSLGRLWYYPFHFLFFITVLVPAKLLALLTLWDTRWGTRGMGGGLWGVLLLWNMGLLGGVAWSGYKVIVGEVWKQSGVWIWECVVGSFIGVGALMYMAFLVGQRAHRRYLRNDVEGKAGSFGSELGGKFISCF
ncbi:Hyaluronan synthase 3 [Rhizoclosmatium sp. JEL0117]|nr:Hyaluronan synthase 3 [Rhizoclosmatium sp. JEL0117]